MAETSIAFVTKKVLVTFMHPICLMIGENAVFAQAAICEYQQSADDERLMNTPHEFLIVGLPDGKKLTRSLRVRVQGYSVVSAMVELE